MQVGNGGRVVNEDARRGDIVFITMQRAAAEYSPEQRATLLGDWELSFMVGTVIKRDKDTDPKLTLRAYEPYHVGTDGEPDMPLWAWKAKQGNLEPPVAVSTAWKDVINLPWKQIIYLPVNTYTTHYAQKVPGKNVQQNWKETGCRVVDPLPSNPSVNGILRYEALLSLVAKVMQRVGDEVQPHLPKECPIIKFEDSELRSLRDLPEEVRLKMLSSEAL